MSWIEDDQDAAITTRQENYMKNISNNLNMIIPTNKQNRYCLLFGKKIIFDFATKQEAISKMAMSPILLLLVEPLN